MNDKLKETNTTISEEDRIKIQEIVSGTFGSSQITISINSNQNYKKDRNHNFQYLVLLHYLFNPELPLPEYYQQPF